MQAKFTICRALLICAASLMLGCVPTLTQFVVDVNPTQWNSSDITEISYNNTDSVSLYDISVIVRLNRSFTGHYLPLRIETVTPDTLVFSEPFLVNIPAPFNDNFNEIEQPYRLKARLKHGGTYRFNISPLNDGLNVVGVSAVGVNITKSKSN